MAEVEKRNWEPFLPAELEDEEIVDPTDWTCRALHELARQLGVMNDYFYPLMGAVGMLKQQRTDVKSE